MSIKEDLNWRYATKKFDPKKKIPKKDLDELLEALRMSPSSRGMQLWKFLVITDKKLREKLRQHAHGQPQITDASQLIVLCIRTDIDDKHVARYIKRIMEVRKVSHDSLKAYKESMIKAINSKTQEEREMSARHQIYIALGMLLAACAQKRIDACPMEGFDPEKFDQELDLKKKNLKSVVLCTVGYRSEDDDYIKKKKVRFEKKDVFEFI